MARTARAFVLASGERYASLVINLVATAVLSRLLTPAEFGLVAIGFAAAALMEGIREFSAANYLVQAQELTRDALRTVFTIDPFLGVVQDIGLDQGAAESGDAQQGGAPVRDGTDVVDEPA